MKSDSRAFSVKCPTPSKSTATQFLLHNLRSCRHPAMPPPQESILTQLLTFLFSRRLCICCRILFIDQHHPSRRLYLCFALSGSRFAAPTLPSSAEVASRRTHPPHYLRQHRPLSHYASVQMTIGPKPNLDRCASRRGKPYQP